MPAKKQPDKLDWLVKEDESGYTAIRLAGGHTVRLTDADAEALETGLAKLRAGSTVYINRSIR